MNETKLESGWMSWRFFGLSLLFWSGFSLLQMLVPVLTGPVEFGGWANVLAAIAYAVLPYAVMTPVLFAIAERLARRRARGLPYVMRLAAVIVVAAALRTGMWGVRLVFEGGPLTAMLTTAFLGEWLRCGAIVATAVAVMHYRIGQERRRELMKAQLSALRSQLRPHFLFNALQAIGATARSDADTTVRMTALLGDLLRQSLRERSGDLVTLADERDLLLPYVELQRLRFGERLTIELDLGDDVLDAEVPDLVLQPLVENALRHGIEATPGAGTVVVRARRDGRDLLLQVVDDGAGPPAETIDGVGLGTTRARLQGLFGGAASLTMAPAGVRGTTVTVRLPLRQQRSTRAA
ncbi:MAG: histidine kinase [Planctomycetes bacterium]|nr:histidine kinase [Planctomycetota bacterium]